MALRFNTSNGMGGSMKKKFAQGMLALIASLTCLTVSTGAAVPSRETAQGLGFSAPRIAALDHFYETQVQRGDMAGIVLLIARHGKIAHQAAIGYADLESRKPLTLDALYRWYSMTKPITSTAMMMLYEQGRFQLKDPVSKYIPEFANLRVLRKPDGPLTDTGALERPLTIQDVMRHTAGFTHGLGVDPYEKLYTEAQVFGVDVPLSDMMRKLASIPLHHQPGTTFEYGVGPDIQARLVEVLSGMPFDEYLRRNLFEPLKMKDTGFYATGDAAQRLVPVSWSKQGKLVPLDEVHGHPDGGVLVEPWSVNSYTENHQRKGGSFGLIGTAGDYLRFAQMMLNGGQLDGVRILSPRTVAFMTRDHLGAIEMPSFDGGKSGMGFGLGFAVIKDPAMAGEMSSAGTVSGNSATY